MEDVISFRVENQPRVFAFVYVVKDGIKAQIGTGLDSFDPADISSNQLVEIRMALENLTKHIQTYIDASHEAERIKSLLDFK